MSDEELIKLAQSGDSSATETLLQRYKNAVRSVARTFFLAGGETEDLIQEGMCGLYSAIQNFRAGKMSFKNFAFLCIYRRIVSTVKNATRKKHNPLNDYVSFDDYGVEEKILSESDPEGVLIGNESLKELTDAMKTYLSEGEYECLMLYIKGHSLSEIANLTDRNEKSVDNAIQRAKKKIEKKLKGEK